MTRADIFRHVASVGLDVGFAAGERLPEQPGKMGGVLVIEIEAKPRMESSAITSSLISSLGDTPARNLEQRGRQLARLIESAGLEYHHLVLVAVIGNANLLPPKTIKELKRLRESQGGPPLGIVLLGDMSKLGKKINALPEISQRTELITLDGELKNWQDCLKSSVE